MRSKEEIKFKINELHDNRRHWIKMQNGHPDKEEKSSNKFIQKEQDCIKMIELLEWVLKQREHYKI